MSEIKIKVKLDENAKMPEKAHSSDAGWDLFAPEDFTVQPSTAKALEQPIHFVGFEVGSNIKYFPYIGSITVDTGVHMQIPEGYVGMIKSKSGLNVKHGLIAEGTIDANYTGSIVVKLYNLSSEPYHFKKHDKITQIVVIPIPQTELIEVDELDDTERGENGFGSSGR